VRQACSRLLARSWSDYLSWQRPGLAQERSRRPLRTWNHLFSAALARFCPRHQQQYQAAFARRLFHRYCYRRILVCIRSLHSPSPCCPVAAAVTVAGHPQAAPFAGILPPLRSATRPQHSFTNIEHCTSHAIAPLPWPAHRSRHLLATHPIRSLTRLHACPTCP
jgi:hypothetical protein